MPLLLGFLFGGVGFAVGAGLLGAVRSSLGLEFWSTDMSWSIAYPFALLGWLAGVGGWKYWATEWFGGTPAVSPKGVSRYFEFNMDHKVIGIQYGVTFVALFLLSGLTAMAIRYELMHPGMQLFNEDQYNAAMSFHGIGMVAVAVAIIMGCYGNYVVPIMIGARDMAFPRINALSFWLVPPVAITLVIAVLLGGWDTGWTAYPPLSVLTKSGQTLFNLAVITFGVVSILGGINFIVTIIYERAPGMTWGRLPIMVWGTFAGSIIAFFFTQGFAAEAAVSMSAHHEGRSHRGAAFVYVTALAIVFGLVWSVSFAWWLMLPTSRIVALDVPPGTAAAIARGEQPDVIPSTLLLRRGDTLAIRNEDDVVHRVGLMSIAPGRTERVTVDEAMLNGPALLCTIHPSGALSISALARPGIEATIFPTLFAGIPIAWSVLTAIFIIRRL